MKKQSKNHFVHEVWPQFRWLLCVLVAGLCGLLPVTRVWAHGGVIINNGFTERYEWLVYITPYPATTGDIAVSLQVYDIDTYQLVNGLNIAVYVALPGDSSPCCTDQHIGPLPVDIQPQVYPGDYSAFLRLDRVGTWQIQFRVQDEEGSFEVITPFDVGVNTSSIPLPTLAGAVQVMADGTTVIPTATPLGVSGVENRSPSATPVATPTPAVAATAPAPSGLQATVAPSPPDQVSALRGAIWPWGIMGLVPVVLLILWFLRAPADVASSKAASTGGRSQKKKGSQHD